MEMAAVLMRGHVRVRLGMVVLILLTLGTSAFALLIDTTAADCSNECESRHCKDPFRLRYGKFCGIGYTGCDGTPVCDGLDSCCMIHDKCIGSNLENYVNRTCNEDLRNCVQAFKHSNMTTFAGANCSASNVESVIIYSMDVVTGTLGSTGPRPLITNLRWVSNSVCILSALLLRYSQYSIAS